MATFFLNLHRIGYTVFLILCLIKVTRIHEDSNIYIEERRCSTCDVTHCVTEIHYLKDSVCWTWKRIQESTIFMHGTENVFLPIISSCSNLAGCHCERELCRYALKMREGIWMRWHAWWMRPKRTVTCLWFDLLHSFIKADTKQVTITKRKIAIQRLVLAIKFILITKQFLTVEKQ